MSDFLQPFVIILLSQENTSLAITFLCFDAFLTRVNRIAFLKDVSRAARPEITRTNVILRRADIALMQKRPFPNFPDSWLQIHCSPAPTQWFPCMICAILLLSLKSLLDLSDLSVACFNSEFPNIRRTTSIDDVRWLS
jgi:hypothetical protein